MDISNKVQTTRVSRSLAAVALAGALVIAPAAVFAHNDGQYDKGGAHAAGSELSVQINDNGKALVRGAKVTSVSGSTISATTSFGSTSVGWTVTTDTSTKVIDKGGRTLSLNNISVGDIVSFSGTLNANASSLTVAATNVKDWTKNLAVLDKHTFEGKLLAAIGSTTLPTNFLLAVGNTNYTVNVPAGTPILAKNWSTTTLGSFQTNDTVRIYGSLQSANLTTIDAVVVRNATR